MVLKIGDDGRMRFGIERELGALDVAGEVFQLGTEVFEEEDEAAHRRSEVIRAGVPPGYNRTTGCGEARRS